MKTCAWRLREGRRSKKWRVSFAAPTTKLPYALRYLGCDGVPHFTDDRTMVGVTRAERFYRTDGWAEVGRKEDGQIIFQKSL
jgi:hypothetical protein